MYVLHQTHSEFLHIQHCVFFFQIYASIVNHIHHYQGIFTYIETYSGIFRLIQPNSAPCITWHICNLVIFWALAYLELKAYLKPYEKLTRYIQSSAIGHYITIFRHIQNLAQLLHMHKPGIIGILEYSEFSHNCFLTHIQNLAMFTKI